MNKKEQEVYNWLKKFVVEEVHEADFDQGNSLQETLSVLEVWWEKQDKESFKDVPTSPTPPTKQSMLTKPQKMKFQA